MALSQSYHRLWFVSFRLSNTSGHREPVQLKLKPNQSLPQEITAECKARGQNAFELLAARKRAYVNVTNYPEGTRFLLEAKLTDREGGTMYFYSDYRRQPVKIVKPNSRPSSKAGKVYPLGLGG